MYTRAKELSDNHRFIILNRNRYAYCYYYNKKKINRTSAFGILEMFCLF